MNTLPVADLDSLWPVLTYIETHLGEPLPLERLAEVASLSPIHFHRKFRDTLSEPPAKYVERLRLERAAFSLRYMRDTVGEIAIDVGYASHEAFSRAFRRRFGCPPSQYRSAPIVRQTEPPPSPANLPDAPWSISSPKIRDVNSTLVAFLRNLGPYERVDFGIVERLLAWEKRRYGANGGQTFGIGHDDPQITSPEKIRFDFCVALPAPIRADGEVGIQRLPSGPHAVFTYVGPLGPILSAAYMAMGARLSELERHRPTGLPVIEAFRSTLINKEAAIHTIDVHFPVVTL